MQSAYDIRTALEVTESYASRATTRWVWQRNTHRRKVLRDEKPNSRIHTHTSILSYSRSFGALQREGKQLWNERRPRRGTAHQETIDQPLCLTSYTRQLFTYATQSQIVVDCAVKYSRAVLPSANIITNFTSQ